ncbi:response regulator, partial [bacterium]|nr:response regulator [bacterium]
NGVLDAWKTEGGHRRINRASIKRLLDGEVRPKRAEVIKDTGGTKVTGAAQPRPGAILKVLIVEDDSVLLKLYKPVLGNWNLPLDITTASNGADALIRVGRDSPDVMITDLAMPGVDGIHLIRCLANTSYREGMEIIIVSGLDRADIETRGGLPSGIRVFSKPVPFNALRSICSDALQRRAAYLSEERRPEETELNRQADRTG